MCRLLVWCEGSSGKLHVQLLRRGMSSQAADGRWQVAEMQGACDAQVEGTGCMLAIE